MAGGERNHGVTLSQVADEAGVSLAAASFVMSGRSGGGPSGSTETRAKVLAAADRLGYVPNRHAQAMRTGRSNVIALELGSAADPWNASMWDAVQHAAHPLGMTAVMLPDDTAFTFLQGYQTACALITGVEPPTHDSVRRLAATGQQVVAFTSHDLEPTSFDVIQSSPTPAVRAAYAQLRHQHPRVTLLTHMLPDSSPYPNRTDMFLTAVRDLGDDPSHAGVVFVGGTLAESYRHAHDLLAGPQRPVAVVAATGFVAQGAQAAAAQLGLRVPEDLEIISLGDVPSPSQMLDPISYWGVRDVFARTARIVVHRATQGRGAPGRIHRFTWEFFAGSTTREESST